MKIDVWTGKPINKRKNAKISMRNLIWEEQNGKCRECHDQLSPASTELHHINGKRSDTRRGNLELLCSNCHKSISNKRRTNIRKRNKPTDIFGRPITKTSPFKMFKI